jgi:hypothetical protein
VNLITRAKSWARENRAAWDRVEGDIIDQKMLQAKLLIYDLERRINSQAPLDLRDAEFKVFSQFGEDGIIQYLIRRAAIAPESRVFVEFGVETYVEANTRFLLMNDNWRGLVMDGGAANISALKRSDVFWKHDLTAKAAFIDRDNINDLVASGAVPRDIGLLSIDIDGNDYWVWERISVIDPMIVVIEYNSLFGAEKALTIPYDPEFVRGAAHYSHLYWGCSLRALELLGKRKGYALVGSNSAGNNAFFLRRDCLNGQAELTAKQAYVRTAIRDSRDREGRLNYLSFADRQREIADKPVWDVEQDKLLVFLDCIQ